MAFNLTRMTIYALISAVEEDLRAILKEHVTDQSVIDKELLERAKYRAEKDIGVLFEDIELKELIGYFDLGDTYQVINSNSTIFPKFIYDTIKNSTKSLEKIVSIRNRVMHIRPLNFDDLSLINSFCEGIVDNGNLTVWSNIRETINRLETDPSFVLSLDIMNYDEDEVIHHNLPMPDFDETGLIGRDEEVEQVKKLCFGSFPVISIVGEGGVGKSALALKVAYDLIEKNSPFDAVVWVTSKTTQITLHEIKEIKGAINTSLGVIQEIGNKVIGENFGDHTFDEVIEYLSTFKIALFIDNLETILDDNIKHFVSALPQGSKIIITSRIGLGAYEYPIKLQGIEESYASKLLRTVAKIRGVDSIFKLPEANLRKYVNRMHRNPSYIKWFVSSVQTGISPESVLQNSGNFLDFCMSNVYQYLSKDAQKVTMSLQCANGFRDLPELAHLNDFDALQTQKSIQELMSTNMLSQRSANNGASVKTMYQLSELARSYLGKHHKPSQSFQKLIRDKRNKLNALFEQQMSQQTANKYLSRNIQFREKSDRVIVKKLHDVQSFISKFQYDQAFEILQEAQRLAPDFFEVARFMGYFYQKTGNYSDAREQYELAIILSSESPQLYYWFGKFLLYSEEDLDEATNSFEMAYKLDPTSAEVALALARAYLYQHKFEEAQTVLNSIKLLVENSDEYLIQMYHDTLVQIKYREADDLSKTGDYENILKSLEDMMQRFDDVPEKYKDRHMRKKIGKCDFIINKISKNIPINLEDRFMNFKNWFDKEKVK